jgi:hypothetical protein
MLSFLDAENAKSAKNKNKSNNVIPEGSLQLLAKAAPTTAKMPAA